MPIGPGKYDDACTAARIATGATAILLAVIGGNNGSGFSLHAPPAIAKRLPELLRHIADEIEAAQQEP
jgi:hypothetical protein